MKFDFINNDGETLSGRLELPAGIPRAFALFAHCFTCSKDIIAANVIAKSLTRQNIGVLRFDFTGLGNSEGDFANTNFSSNVQDLISACKYLGKEFKHPEILIGHSLGGAAVLKAATFLDHVKAIVTIGAPSCVNHVEHLFEQDLKNIEKLGHAEVNLAGRKFTIKKQFIDDIKEVDILKGVKNFKKALLVMHSPTDNTVSIDHASKIFSEAKHPKSFVSLDKADHLLLNREDASYAGAVIGAWVQKYISKSMKISDSILENTVVVQSRNNFKFTQDIYTKDHHIVADEPKSVKGNHLGMNPYDLVLAGLGACTSMTIKMYAERKGLLVDKIAVELSHEKVHSQDCVECDNKVETIDIISKKITIDGTITPEEKKRLYEVAEKCPVNKTLQSHVKIESIT